MATAFYWLGHAGFISRFSYKRSSFFNEKSALYFRTGRIDSDRNPNSLDKQENKGEVRSTSEKMKGKGGKAGRARASRAIAAVWALAQPRRLCRLAWKPSQLEEQASLRIKRDPQPLPHDEGRLV